MQGGNRKVRAVGQGTRSSEVPNPRELNFDRDSEPVGRAGDRRRRRDVTEELPPERVRQAGLSGRDDIDGGVTADDLSPETLLDDDRSHSPSDYEHRESMDTLLREVDEADIGEGQGLDEAELADTSPIDSAELARRQRDAAITAYPGSDIAEDKEIGRAGVRHRR